MKQKNKFSTILYIFLLTVVPQAVVLCVVASVGCWAYWWYKTQNWLQMMLSLVGFITMIFFFICVSVFVHSYGLSVFSSTTKDLNASDYEGKPVKEYSLRVGRRNTLTGKTPIYVKERERRRNGLLVMVGFHAIIVGLTGVFKFVIESLRVSFSRRRQADWETCREDIQDKILGEGVFGFFKMPIICTMIFCILWATLGGLTWGFESKYSHENIDIEITEISQGELNGMRASVSLKAKVTNNSKEKIDYAKGTLYIKDAKGDLLFQCKLTIQLPFNHPNGEFMEKSQTYELSWNLNGDPNNEGMMTLYNSELEDLEISFAFQEIKYGEKTLLSDPKVVDLLGSDPIVIKESEK
ncbi:MAG: hypothetical protein E7679_05395 [Ruminococcaceae bacterium]|nr:hypothetical protein [Oscillospiraceae bacterium]